MSDKEKFREYMKEEYVFGGLDGSALNEDEVEKYYDKSKSLDENVASLDEVIDKIYDDMYPG